MRCISIGANEVNIKTHSSPTETTAYVSLYVGKKQAMKFASEIIYMFDDEVLVKIYNVLGPYLKTKKLIHDAENIP